MSLSHPSPNQNDRRGQEVQLIVLHADASPSEAGTLSWLQSSESKVSYHALIGRNGRVYTCVPYGRRAWHAGKAVWKGHKDVNGISIGLCFANKHDGVEALTKAQTLAMQMLIDAIRNEYGQIPVTTHAAVATPAGRKTDPEKAVGFALEHYA